MIERKEEHGVLKLEVDRGGSVQERCVICTINSAPHRREKADNRKRKVEELESVIGP